MTPMGIDSVLVVRFHKARARTLTNEESRECQCHAGNVYPVLVVIEGTLERSGMIYSSRDDACHVDEEYDEVDKEEDSAEGALCMECKRTAAYKDSHASRAHIDGEAATA